MSDTEQAAPVLTSKNKSRLAVKDLADLWDVSEQAVVQFLRRPGAPMRGKDGKYPAISVLKFRSVRMEEIKQATGKAEPGSIGAARYHKIELECEKLQIQVDQARGQLVGIEEVRSTLIEYGGHVNDAWEQFVSQVAARTHNAELVGIAEKLADEARTYLAEAVRGAE